jgi:hypothetical protein
MVRFCLPSNSLEMNHITILQSRARYHWRCFVTRTTEIIDAGVEKLPDRFGSDSREQLNRVVSA